MIVGVSSMSDKLLWDQISRLSFAKSNSLNNTIYTNSLFYPNVFLFQNS